jgi:hypothetical protein
MIYKEISNSNDKLILLKNDRDKLVRESFSTKIEKIWELNRLAITAYKSGFGDFGFETFEIVFDLLSKPYDFYECYDLLKSLNQTDFSNLTNQLREILYRISENYQEDLTDKLLLKLKLFEVSNSKFKKKLDSELLAMLFNRIGQYRINNSLSDSLPVFINYLIKSNSIKIAKGILIIFQEYLIEIVEQMIFENEQSDNQVKLKDFYQIIKQDEIGTKKYCELELLICKL